MKALRCSHSSKMSTSGISGFVLRGGCKYFLSYKELCLLRKNSLKSLRCFSSGNMQKISGPRKSNMFLGVIGVGVGALVGAGYSYHKLQQSQVHVMNPATGRDNPILETLPDVPVTRQVISPSDNTGLKLKLYQYPTCPFCCKVRAFFDYYGFSYDVVEVNPVLKQQISWSDYKKVPIVLAQVENGYQQLLDSTMIISTLTSYLHDRDQSFPDVVNCYPTISYKDESGTAKEEILNRYFLMFQDAVPTGRTKEDIMLERKWRKWADDVLVHMLSPNVYRTPEEALQSFKWFSEVGEWDKNFPAWERYLIIYAGAFAMWIISKRLKKRHYMKDDVRQSLYDECNVWVRTLKKQGTKFLGGKSPNLADLAVYGVLSSIEGCRAFQDLLKNTQIDGWYQAMQECVQKHAGSAVLSR